MDVPVELSDLLAGCPTYGPAGGEYVELAAALDACEMAAFVAGRWK